MLDKILIWPACWLGNWHELGFMKLLQLSQLATSIVIQHSATPTPSCQTSAFGLTHSILLLHRLRQPLNAVAWVTLSG